MGNVTTASSGRCYRMSLILTEWKKCEDGGWVVAVWGIPGLATQGKDEREARLGIIDCYLMTLDAMEDEGADISSLFSESPKNVWEDSELRRVRLEHSERVDGHSTADSRPEGK